MMDKIASDSYSQGAYDALEQMGLAPHVKQASAEYLIKESSRIADIIAAGRTGLQNFGGRVAGGARSARDAVATRLSGTNLDIIGSGALARRGGDAQAARALMRDRIIGGGLGAAGVTALGANAMGAFDDDPPPAPEGFDALSDAEKAALIAGGVGAVGAAGYGLSQLM